MSDHELVWTHACGSVWVEAVCHAKADANCRLTSACDCDSWVIERDDGGPFHLSSEWREDGEIVNVRHDMRPGDYCNVCEFLNGDPSLLIELGIGPSFEIGRTPISPVREGDDYSWEPIAKGSTS